MTVTITHTRAEGTLAQGMVRGDGSYEILRANGFRWFRSLGCAGIQSSRDKGAKTWRINAAAAALREAGFEVEVTVDETVTRDFAEAEQERYNRAEDRADRYADRAERRAAAGQTAHDRAHQIAEGIPFGQPILVGHHSEGRHRRDLDRIHNGHGKGFELERQATYWKNRAQAAEHYELSRRNVPRTLRRIEKLEADLRGVERALDGRELLDNYRVEGGKWVADVVGRTMPEGDYLARLKADKADLEGELAYWRELVAKAEADGFKVWGPDDFTKGDFALIRGRWWEIKRVNKKTLTTAAIISDPRGIVIRLGGTRITWNDTQPYNEVRGRKTAEEIAAMENPAGSPSRA